MHYMHTYVHYIHIYSPTHIFPVLNSFTLRAPLEPNVCYFHTFENNLKTERKFTKYLKESCSLASVSK